MSQKGGRTKLIGAMKMNGIHHEVTGSSDVARIHIHGLERDMKLLQLTDSHLTEADERDPEAAVHVKQRGPGGFFKSTPNGESTLEVFDRTLAKARASGIDGAVLTGDIIDFPTWAGIDHVARGMKALAVPTLYTPGNHDWHFPHLAWSPAVRQQYYPRLYGLTNNSPAFQSMELGGVRLIALDNSTYQISPEQLSFLHQELATGQPCLLFLHIPVWTDSLMPKVMKHWGAPIMMATPDGWTVEMRKQWNVPGNEPSTLECFDLLTRGESTNLAGIFCGHVHFAHADSYRDERYQYVTAPGFGGGYRIIELIKA